MVALCTRGNTICTGGDDGWLRLIDRISHRVLKSVSLGNEISCVAMAPKLPLVVAGIGVRKNPTPGGKEGVFYVVSTKDMSCKALGRDSMGCIRAVKFTPRGGQFVLASQDGCIYVYYLEYRKRHRDYKVWLRGKVDFGLGPVENLDFSADGHYLQCEVRNSDELSAAGNLRYVDFLQQDLGKHGEENAEWDRHVDMQTKWATWTCKCGWAVNTVGPRYTELTAVARTSGGEILASTDQFGRLTLVRAPSLTERPTRVVCYMHGSRATNVATSDDGRHLFTIGGNDRCLVQWRMEYDPLDADMVSAVQRTKELKLEIQKQKQRLRTVRAALKTSLKPLIEERQFVQAKVNSWRQRVKKTMIPLEKYVHVIVFVPTCIWCLFLCSWCTFPH